MFDIGWAEMAVVAVVALIVIGPRDLPKVLYGIGKFAARARAMLRDLQQGIEDMAREAELEEVKSKVEAARNFDVRREIEKTVDPKGTLAETLNPTLNDGDVQRRAAGPDEKTADETPPPLASQPVEADEQRAREASAEPQPRSTASS